ncbi:MAG: response regulator [Candidatus Sumerlaeaceae bacterium]|jgi:DNA-binding response OmpR family regulator
MITQTRFRVLVVDDDKDILDMINITLSPSFEVLTLQESVDALEIIDVFEPDILIVDIMMPKVTGYQIIELMRQNPRHQHVIVVVLSAKDSSRDIKYGYKLGANLYLTKPFQPDRLLKNIQMLATGLGKPRPKSYSLRDVQLRLQLLATKKFATPTTDPNVTPTPPDVSSSSFRLRRPLAQEADEQEKKKWVD